MKPEVGKELLMVLDEIYHLFADIRDIAEQQLLLARQIVNDPDISAAMLKLMERRQAITRRIDKLSKKIPGYDGLIVNNNEQTELIAVINDIQGYDRQSQKLVEAGRKQAGEKLGNLRNSQKAYNAYMPNVASTEGWFFDRKK
ncbi:MAG: flagellar protein FliT [Syntrophomonas sp.]